MARVGPQRHREKRNKQAVPGGRAASGVDLRPLACWGCGFESRRGNGCLSVVNVMCGQVEVSATS